MSNNAPHQEPPSAKEQAAQRLKSYVDRIEGLNEQRAALSSDIKDIFQEIKSAGFYAAAVKKLLAERKLIAKVGQEEYETQELLLSTYRDAIDRLGKL